MHETLYFFIYKQSIFKQEQFGFTKNKPTAVACFAFIKLVSSSLNEKKKAILTIFLDMSKAFVFVAGS